MSSGRHAHTSSIVILVASLLVATHRSVCVLSRLSILATVINNLTNGNMHSEAFVIWGWLHKLQLTNPRRRDHQPEVASLECNVSRHAAVA